MIYGMEDNDEFALVSKPHLNKKKIFLIVGIIVAAIIVMSVIIFSTSNKESVSGEGITLESGEHIQSNEIASIENNNQNNSEEKQLSGYRIAHTTSEGVETMRTYIDNG